jgi:hypothetical protein
MHPPSTYFRFERYKPLGWRRGGGDAQRVVAGGVLHLGPFTARRAVEDGQAGRVRVARLEAHEDTRLAASAQGHRLPRGLHLLPPRELAQGFYPNGDDPRGLQRRARLAIAVIAATTRHRSAVGSIVQEAVSRDRKLVIRYRKGTREGVERVVDPLGLCARQDELNLKPAGGSPYSPGPGNDAGAARDPGGLGGRRAQRPAGHHRGAPLNRVAPPRGGSGGERDAPATR